MPSKSSAKSRSTTDSKPARRPGRMLAIAVLGFSVAGLASAVVGVFDDGVGGITAIRTTDEADGTNNADSANSTDSTDDAENAGAVAGVQAEADAQPALGEAPPRLGAYQELVDLDGWINSNAVDLSSFDGQVRIVKFWTFGCVNCKNTLPHLRDIYGRWEPQGLEIIGVHSPEFDYESDPDAVAQATVDQNIPWPVALDTNKTNFRSWQGSRRFWPRTYVIDQAGQIRYDHVGEGRYDRLEATVSFLIENPGA